MQNITFLKEGKCDARDDRSHEDPRVSRRRGGIDLLHYVEQLECYFIANDVANAIKQRTILLSCCGASTYSLIRSLAGLSKPTDKSLTTSWWRNSWHTLPRDAPGLPPDSSLARVHSSLASPSQHTCLSYRNLL